MKRKILIGLIVIAGLTASYFIFRDKLNPEPYPGFNESFDAKEDIEKGKIVLISYGLPIYPYEPKMQAIAKKYGFQYDNRGCMVIPVEQEAANKYNKKMIEYLKSKNGDDWYARYQKEIDSLDIVISRERDTIASKCKTADNM